MIIHVVCTYTHIYIYYICYVYIYIYIYIYYICYIYIYYILYICYVYILYILYIYICIYTYVYIYTLDMTMYVCTSLMIPSPRCSMSLSPIETLTEYAGSVSSWGPKFLLEERLLLDNNWVWVNMFTQRKWLICKRSQNLDLLCWLKMLPHF